MSIFCLLNCFNNYEIVSETIIKMYIKNAINSLSSNTTTKVMSLTDSTPYFLYSLYLLPGNKVQNLNASKQYQDYITILGLASVVLARIVSSDITVYARQDMTDLPGFSTMLAIANQLNKKVVMWTDDLRNLWGTSDDPLVIGMSPLPYKYLWSADTKNGQDSKYDSQPKLLNGNVVPALASSDNLCPTISTCTLEKCWNTFITLINEADVIQTENKAGTLNLRCSNLSKIGQDIISYVENTKDQKYGRGWNPAINYTLWWDIQYVVLENLGLLYSTEKEFISANLPTTTPVEFVETTKIYHKPYPNIKSNMSGDISKILKTF